MKITFAMLCYVLQKHCPLKTVHMGTAEIVLEQDISARINFISSGDKLQDFLLDASVLQAFLFLNGGPSDEDLRLLSPRNSWAVLEEPAEKEKLKELIYELTIHILEWDARFDAAILRREDAKKILSWGREFLPGGYALIDRDLFYLYSTPDYAQPADPETLRLPRDVADSLLLDSKFHAAADKQDIFYYKSQNDNSNWISLCGNIFLNQQDYYARLVMSAGKGTVCLPPGAEQFFKIFVKHVEDLISYGNAFADRRSKNDVQQLFASILAGERWTVETQEDILQTTGWGIHDTYVTVIFNFYEDEGWSTQLETTLPYLVHELEQEWPESCSFFYEDMAICVWNISHSSGDWDSHALHQRVAAFLREHVCRAGISPFFEGIEFFPTAVKAAKTALRLGRSRNPETWIYSFDDYRLDYIMEKLREDFPFPLLCHPAIRKLMAWDTEHGTEFSRTLETYLECHLNMTAAAEKLYIHRTSFCRKMDHIRKFTGLDIADPQEILMLMISYGLLR